MSVLWFLLPMALGLGVGFTVAFILAVKSGQMDDVQTPAYRILNEEDP